MATIVTRAGKGSPLTHTEVDTNFTNLNTNKLETAAIPLGTLAAPSISFLSDANTGIYSPAADTVAFVTAGSNRVHITSGGLVGIGTISPDAKLLVSDGTNINTRIGQLSLDNFTGEGAGIRFSRTTSDDSLCALGTLNAGDGDLGLFSRNSLIFATGGASNYSAASEKARLDSSGRLLVGTSSSSAEAKFIVQGGSTGAGGAVNIQRNATTASAGSTIGFISFTNSSDNVGAQIVAGGDGTWSAGTSHPTNLVFSTTPSGSASPSPRMTITNAGVILGGNTSVNGSHPKAHLFKSTETTDGAGAFIIESSNATNGTSIFVGVGAAGVGYNASNCVLGVYRCSSNSRSINAAGSINASGADYAEYMTKAGDFIIAKGDVCGIDAEGKLTNIFIDSLGFLVKSTDPSYVGGDTWGLGLEDDPEGLETARQAVDRVAFAGQVPVNVMGATPGQYIVPSATEDGGITGIAKDEADLTLAEYMQAVGKVIAIEDDGRARIIVKVA